MAETIPPKVIWLCAITFAPSAPIDDVLEDLEKSFGPINRYSARIDFNHTDYYAAEMGTNLKKFLVSFQNSFAAENLWLVKKTTIDIENIYAHNGKRQVNLDPGYIEQSKLVLASTKNFSHRIYLNQGIFAEVTLIYSKGHFEKLPWTYPDYLEPAFIEFLVQLRTDCKSS